MSFFERERRARRSPMSSFLALLSSLSFFQKSDDETAFQIPPRDARARERERESKEKERVERERERRNDDDDDRSRRLLRWSRASSKLSDARTAKGPQRSRKGKRKDPTRERERERE